MYNALKAVGLVLCIAGMLIRVGAHFSGGKSKQDWKKRRSAITLSYLLISAGLCCRLLTWLMH